MYRDDPAVDESKRRKSQSSCCVQQPKEIEPKRIIIIKNLGFFFCTYIGIKIAIYLNEIHIFYELFVHKKKMIMFLLNQLRK